MEESKRDPELAALVMRSHPGARTTYEIVHQLRELLPIESPEEFERHGRLSVAGEELNVQDLRHALPAELFPVRDEADLVKKVAAAVRVAGHLARRSQPGQASDAMKRLVAELAGESAGPTSAVPVGLFAGPALLDAPPEDRS